MEISPYVKLLNKYYLWSGSSNKRLFLQNPTYQLNIIAGLQVHLTCFLNQKELDDEVKLLQSDKDIKIAISKLKLLFQQSTEALIHGDFHTGASICD